jgi:hypothetical protein
MPDLTYPSSLFPARPSFTVTTADGWSAHAIEGAEFAVSRDGDEDGFTPVMTVHIQRAPGACPIEDIAPSFVEGVSGLPGAVILSQEFRQVLNAPGFQFEATFTGPEGRTLFQAIHLAAVEQGAWTDIVSFVACATSGQYEETISEVRDMLDSIAAA